MIKHHIAVARALAAVALGGCCADAGAQLRFEPPVVNSNRVRLSLVGDPGGSYAIESSTDLVNWVPVFSGVAENGRLEAEAEVQSATRMFYRGRADEEALGGGTLDVTPTLWTNYATHAFATAEGSSTRLFANDRTEFTLTFPSNSVASGLVASMTLVTNVAGFPFAGPLLGAVQIIVDDEELLGAAELSIRLTTNVDRRQVVSFRAEADGTDFTLTPDRVSSGVVRIPVLHSGIYGSCLATPQEVAAVVQTINSPATNNIASSARRRLILPTSRLCFPNDVNRALSVRNRIRRQMRPLSASLEAQLNASRQSQLASDTDDLPSALSEAASLTCAFYNQNIAPRWAEASHNCSLMGVLLQFALGMERQLQLLGVPDAERCTANVLSPELLCPGFKDCLQEIKACCSSGHPGKQRLRDLASLTRQQELLGISGMKGLGCFDLGDPAVDEVVDVCIPRTWSGTFSVQETGKRSERTDYARGYTQLDESYEFGFSGFVTEASEINLGSQGFSARLILEGLVVGRKFRDNYSEADNNCQIVVNDDKSEAGVADLGPYWLGISSQPQTGTYVLTAVFGRPDAPFEFPLGEERDEIVSTHIPPGIGCPPATREMVTRTDQQPFGGPPLLGYVGTLSGDVFAGKYTGPGTGGGLTTTVEITWRLVRKKVQ